MHKKTKILLVLGLIIFVIFVFAFLRTNRRPNIVFISVDDMNNWISVLKNYPGIKTPNLERLARMGVLFKEAHAASPVCNPSRFSILTGLLPSSSGVYNKKSPTAHLVKNKKYKFIMDYFKDQGYHVTGFGKIFHEGINQYYPWDCYKCFSKKKHSQRINSIEDFTGSFFDWGISTGDESKLVDVGLVNNVEKFFKNDHHREPFFLAIGMHNPHMPWIVPKRFFDLYDPQIIKANLAENDTQEIPQGAYNMIYAEDESLMLNSTTKVEAIHAYLATLSFTDELLGRILDAIENSEYNENTLIVFWSDHGLHLGEKKHWRKSTLWRNSTHIPLIFAGNNLEHRIVTQAVSLVDVLPTLMDLCEIKVQSKLDGHSLKPLMLNENYQWNYPAITIMNPYNFSAYYQNWHYIQYANYDEELYNIQTDQEELNNLADQSIYHSTIEKLRSFGPQNYRISLFNLLIFAFNDNELRDLDNFDCHLRNYFSYYKVKPEISCSEIQTWSESEFHRFRRKI